MDRAARRQRLAQWIRRDGLPTVVQKLADGLGQRSLSRAHRAAIYEDLQVISRHAGGLSVRVPPVKRGGGSRVRKSADSVWLTAQQAQQELSGHLDAVEESQSGADRDSLRQSYGTSSLTQEAYRRGLSRRPEYSAHRQSVPRGGWSPEGYGRPGFGRAESVPVDSEPVWQEEEQQQRPSQTNQVTSAPAGPQQQQQQQQSGGGGGGGYGGHHGAAVAAQQGQQYQPPPANLLSAGGPSRPQLPPLNGPAAPAMPATGAAPVQQVQPASPAPQPRPTASAVVNNILQPPAKTTPPPLPPRGPRPQAELTPPPLPPRGRPPHQAEASPPPLSPRGSPQPPQLEEKQAEGEGPSRTNTNTPPPPFNEKLDYAGLYPGMAVSQLAAYKHWLLRRSEGDELRQPTPIKPGFLDRLWGDKPQPVDTDSDDDADDDGTPQTLKSSALICKPGR